MLLCDKELHIELNEMQLSCGVTALRVELRCLKAEIAAKIRETQMKVVPGEIEEKAEETVKETLYHSENLWPL